LRAVCGRHGCRDRPRHGTLRRRRGAGDRRPTGARIHRIPLKPRAMRRRVRAAASPAYLVLLLLLVVGLVLRVKNNGYGLPYVYNVDEGSHFTARAVGMLGGDWNPHYFQNPSAFTYLAHFALRFHLGKGAVDTFKLNPTTIYETTRAVAAVLCVVG